MDFYVAGGQYPGVCDDEKKLDKTQYLDGYQYGDGRLNLVCNPATEVIVRTKSDDVISLIGLYAKERGAHAYLVSEDRRSVKLCCVVDYDKSPEAKENAKQCKAIDEFELSQIQMTEVMNGIDYVCKNNFYNFFLGKASNNDGHTFEEICKFDKKRLEREHHYIQWLFPLKEISPHNPEAPTLDGEMIAKLKKSELVQDALRRAVYLMLDHYGFSRSSFEFSGTKENEHWLTPRNHNYKRLTRMLTSMRLLGMEDYSMHLFKALRDLMIEYHGVIGWETFFYWEDAMLQNYGMLF